MKKSWGKLHKLLYHRHILFIKFSKQFVYSFNNHKSINMKKVIYFLLPLFMFNCEGNLNNSKLLKMEKKLNENNNQVTVFVDVSYTTDNFDQVKSFIKNEQCPLFFNLEDSGIVRFEWFINQENKTGTLIEVFENSNAWEELGNKVLGSPINLKFRELFKIEKLTVLGEINEAFKAKIQPMNPIVKTYIGGIN